MKTKLHRFKFDIRNPDEREAFEALKRDRAAAGGGHPMEAWDTGNDKCPEGVVEFDTAFLFNNQWNTVATADHSGYRVFDFYIGLFPHNRGLRRGHWLEITPEMREIRDNTNVCGYCGHQEAAQKGAVFCDECLGSEYLKQSELYLTRMVPVSEHHAPGHKRPPLTDAERDYLLPLYIESQTVGRTAREKKAKADAYARIEREFEKATNKAADKKTAYLFLLDHGWRLDNVIYYDHIPEFCFGWRKPLEPGEVSRLLDFISEFPFPYRIKRTDGDDLEGY